MHRIGQYQIGLYPGLSFSFSFTPSPVWMLNLCDVLTIGEDPIANFQEYADVVGDDLNEMPIEAGFARATWKWVSPMTQNDFNTLLGYFISGQNQDVYIRTRLNSGGSAVDYAVFSARMKRPTGTFNAGMWEEVEVAFVALESVP